MRDAIIYNVTQCQGGTVEMGRYETSTALINAGVTSGYDITTEDPEKHLLRGKKI